MWAKTKSETFDISITSHIIGSWQKSRSGDVYFVSDIELLLQFLWGEIRPLSSLDYLAFHSEG